METESDKENSDPEEEYWNRSWIEDPHRAPFVSLAIMEPHPPLNLRSNDEIVRVHYVRRAQGSQSDEFNDEVERARLARQAENPQPDEFASRNAVPAPVGAEPLVAIPPDSDNGANEVEEDPYADMPNLVAPEEIAPPLPPMVQVFVNNIHANHADIPFDHLEEAALFYGHIRNIRGTNMRRTLLSIRGVGPVTVSRIQRIFPNVGMLVDYLLPMLPDDVSNMTRPMRAIRRFFCEEW